MRGRQQKAGKWVRAPCRKSRSRSAQKRNRWIWSILRKKCFRNKQKLGNGNMRNRTIPAPKTRKGRRIRQFSETQLESQALRPNSKTSDREATSVGAAASGGIDFANRESENSQKTSREPRNYASISWRTSRSGTLFDPGLLFPYKPGGKELQRIRIRMQIPKKAAAKLVYIVGKTKTWYR